MAGLAAAVLMLLAGMAWYEMAGPGTWERYETSVGEQKIVQLPDGSVARLNTVSQVRVRFDDGRREVRLLEGEALFKVAHDSARPFRVLTADAVIRALGTEFNVYARERETRVAVVEGKVEVARPAAAAASKPAQLIAGQTAHIRRDADGVHEGMADVAQTIAWRERRLVFQEETLGEIAAQFNRYNRTPKIVIEDSETALRRYGGSFNADDPQSLVRLVTRSGELQAERRGNEILIRQ
jgi:transmembrane sensor